MSEELRRLKSVRGSYRGHCTQEFKKADRLLKSAPLNTAELKALQDRLTRRGNDISQMDSQIAMAISEEELENEIEEALSVQDTISDYKFMIMEALKNDQHDKPVSSFHDNNSSTKPTTTRINVNLPKLSIQPFNGNQLEWLTFWDSFSAAIDEHTELNNIEKMNYLQNMLKGEAARAIAGLPLTNENYTKAIEILKERFGDKQNIINAYMDSLTRATPPTYEISSLRTFYDSYESNIRGLEALDVKTDTYGCLLIPILLKKLPESIRYAIFRSDSSADKSLDKLRIALRREIETIEKGRLSTTNSYETYDEEPLVPTTGTMLSRTQPRTQSEKQRPKQKKCAYCDGNHWSDNCSEFVTVQERYQVLQRQQRCYNCLGTNHNKTKCFSKRRCMKCKQKHHTSLCHGQTQNPPKDTASNPSTSKIEQTKANTHDEPKETHKEKKTHSDNTHVGTTHVGTTQLLDLQQNQILMHSARTTAIGQGFQCSQAHILFDTGSQRTFITENMRNRLNLKTIRKELLDVTTFGDIKTTRRNYDVVSLNLDTGKESLSLTALVTPTICPPLKIKAFKIPPELEGLKLADTPIGNSEVDILIGNDQYGHLITGKMIKTSNEAMIAIESKFGWLLAGSTSNTRNSNTMGCHRIDTQSAESQLDSILTKFWETNQIPDERNQDDSVMKTFRKTIKFNNTSGRYSVALPWKDNKNDLPSNLNLSVKRLASLQRTLNKRDHALIGKYDKQLQEQLQMGFIEKVPDMHYHEEIVHYIPHFPVFKEDSATTKMRIVYDASAKHNSNSPSLNDCLHTGENLMQDLTGILLRFRAHNVAFIADIEKAFLQIELHPNVRDATRFLWLKDINKPATDTDNLRAYRFQRVLFGATSSPFLLIATIQYHLMKANTWIATDLINSMYMDNVVTGADSQEKAMEYYTLSRKYLKDAGMNLREWNSNSPNLNIKAKEDKCAAKNPQTKVLGLKWDATLDTLSLSLDKMINDISQATQPRMSKRSVLSIASKVFDPLGFVEPITVKAKIMIQDIWKQNMTWDQEIRNDLKEQWIKWLDDIKNLSMFKIPRPYFSDNITSKQLHIFCDSSQRAYGAVAYLRGTSGNMTQTSFVIAKTRVAPAKTQTLPRLELLAALLGANLATYITKTLQLGKECEIVYWSDSQIVLSWLSSNKRLQPFVHTRIRKITQITGTH